MTRQSKELQQFCDIRYFVDTTRNIINDYDNLTKYIKQVKLADDRATDCHNRLYKTDATIVGEKK